MQQDPSGCTSGVLRCWKTTASGRGEPPAPPCKPSSAGQDPPRHFGAFHPKTAEVSPNHCAGGPEQLRPHVAVTAAVARVPRGTGAAPEPQNPLFSIPHSPSPPNPAAGPPRPALPGVSSIAVPPREEGAAGGGGCHWPGSGGRSCRTQLIMLMARGADVLASPRSLSPFLAGRAGGAALARSHDTVFAPLS